MTVREWAGRWQNVCGTGKAATVAHNLCMVRGFVREFGGCSLGALAPLDALEWAARNPGAVRYAKLMLADAVKAGLLERSPLEGARRASNTGLAKADPPSEALLLSLEQKAPERLGEWGRCFARMMLFSAFTGLRLDESARVAVRDVVEVPDLGVTVRFPKGGAAFVRSVGVYSHGRRVLLEALRGVDSNSCRDTSDDPPPLDSVDRPVVSPHALLFPSRTGKVLTRDTVCREWKRLQAGDSAYTWHQLRHFTATYLLNLAASTEDVALQLGHTDGGTQVRQRYGHPDTDLAVARLRRLAV